MTVTIAFTDREDISKSPHPFQGLSTDTKPTVASHTGLPEPHIGDTFFETDTGRPFVTYDGTNWALIVVASVTVSVTVIVAATTNYIAEDVLSDNEATGTYLTFTGVVGVNGGSGRIVGAICIAQGTQVAFRPTLYLFNAVPTSNLNDNAPNTAPAWADRAGFIGKLQFPSLSEKGGSCETEITPGMGGIPTRFKCGASLKDIYAIVITEDAETNEVAGHSYLFSLLIDQL